MALRSRVTLRPGSSVLVLGATGYAGQLAVQITRHLGAGRVIGAGRSPERLRLLADIGADETVSLTGDDETVAERLGQAASDVDVVIVIDYPLVSASS